MPFGVGRHVNGNNSYTICRIGPKLDERAEIDDNLFIQNQDHLLRGQGKIHEFVKKKLFLTITYVLLVVVVVVSFTLKSFTWLSQSAFMRFLVNHVLCVDA